LNARLEIWPDDDACDAAQGLLAARSGIPDKSGVGEAPSLAFRAEHLRRRQESYHNRQRRDR